MRVIGRFRFPFSRSEPLGASKTFATNPRPNRFSGGSAPQESMVKDGQAPRGAQFRKHIWTIWTSQLEESEQEFPGIPWNSYIRLYKCLTVYYICKPCWIQQLFLIQVSCLLFKDVGLLLSFAPQPRFRCPNPRPVWSCSNVGDLNMGDRANEQI